MTAYRIFTQVLPNLPPLEDGIANLLKLNRSKADELISLIETIKAFRVLEQENPSRPHLKGRASGRSVILLCSGDFIIHDMAAKAAIGRVNPDIVMFNHIQYDEKFISQDLQALIQHFKAGYIFGTEFIEISEVNETIGTVTQSMNSEIRFFGNVIISRFLLKDAFRIQLDEEVSFSLSSKNRQSVIGGYHNAIGAKLEVDDRKIWIVNSHLSSESFPKQQSWTAP